MQNTPQNFDWMEQLRIRLAIWRANCDRGRKLSSGVSSCGPSSTLAFNWLSSFLPKSFTLAAQLRNFTSLSRLSANRLSDLAADPWILFTKKVHPLLYDAIFESAHSYGINAKELHHIVTAEEAVHLVLEHAGIAFISKAVALSHQRAGIVVKPLAEEKLRVRTYLALRADNDSRMLNEFARAFLRKCCGADSSAQMSLPIF
jgi:hypothetical protein